MLLRIGYFEDFRGTDTILVCGDDEGLQQVAGFLRTLEDGNAAPVNLHLLPFVRTIRGTCLTAYPAGDERGVQRADSSLNFAWHHSADGWLESAEKITAVVQSGEGHCELGAVPAGDAVVVVSLGEYDDAWWERHG